MIAQSWFCCVHQAGNVEKYAWLATRKINQLTATLGNDCDKVVWKWQPVNQIRVYHFVDDLFMDNLCRL